MNPRKNDRREDMQRDDRQYRNVEWKYLQNARSGVNGNQAAEPEISLRRWLGGVIAFKTVHKVYSVRPPSRTRT
jgi:hypothetical protein